jgi:tripartite-type tricarboxylate transporter receptor subunit TctC
MKTRLTGMAAAAWLAAMIAPAAAQSVVSQTAQADSEFKTVNIVVGFSPGGGYDAYARVLARHYGRNLPGNPNFVVQNMPGASSLKAVQYLDANAPADGSVMTAFNPGLITESLVDPDKIKMKFSDVAWVGSVTRDYRVCYSWHASGIKNWDDLLKHERFNIGAPAAGTSTYINAAILKNMFGVKVHHVTGYPGSAEERLAIERGELDGGCGAWSSNPPEWITNKRINPLVTFSPVPTPNLTDGVPFAGDLVKSAEDKTLLNLMIAADAVGRPFVVSKKVAQNRLAALRRGFDATMKDTQFLTEMQKLDLTVSPIDGAESEKIIATIYAAPAALVERAKEMVK